MDAAGWRAALAAVLSLLERRAEAGRAELPLAGAAAALASPDPRRVTVDPA